VAMGKLDAVHKLRAARWRGKERKKKRKKEKRREKKKEKLLFKNTNTISLRN
jgi:hypothetical protein